MDPTGDIVELRGKSPRERSRPIRLSGSALGARPHICAFFNNPDGEYRVLLPFIKDGFECGEKAFHTVDPRRRDEHLVRLAAAGIDVTATRQTGQLELRNWSGTHLHEGQFCRHKTLALVEGAVKDAKQQGFPLIRFVTHMGWALENNEAQANGVWLLQDGPANPVRCERDRPEPSPKRISFGETTYW
jgi:hypothetical protein